MKIDSINWFYWKLIKYFKTARNFVFVIGGTGLSIGELQPCIISNQFIGPILLVKTFWDTPTYL